MRVRIRWVRRGDGGGSGRGDQRDALVGGAAPFSAVAGVDVAQRLFRRRLAGRSGGGGSVFEAGASLTSDGCFVSCCWAFMYS